ncbi:hypothetical protein ACFWW5_11030 [Streptomyces albidoflavus]
MNDRDILRQASDNSDDWSDETWAAWGRLADQAHGRESVPALLAEVERLRAELAARPTRAEVLREAITAVEDPKQRRATGAGAVSWESACGVLYRLLRAAE